MAAMPMNKEFDKKVEDFFKNYRDRGMVKWAGFYLSDHVLKMHKKSKGHVLGVDEDNVMIADHIVEIEEINYIEIIDKKTP